MGLQWESWTKTGSGGRPHARSGEEEAATGTLVKFDHSYADTIAGLGYPTRSALRAWWIHLVLSVRLNVGTVVRHVPSARQREKTEPDVERAHGVGSRIAPVQLRRKSETLTAFGLNLSIERTMPITDPTSPQNQGEHHGDPDETCDHNRVRERRPPSPLPRTYARRGGLALLSFLTGVCLIGFCHLCGRAFQVAAATLGNPYRSVLFCNYCSQARIYVSHFFSYETHLCSRSVQSANFLNGVFLVNNSLQYPPLDREALPVSRPI